MQVGCPRCGQVLEYSTRPPRFCSDCGQALPMRTAEPTQPFALPTYAAAPAYPPPADPPEQIGGYRLLRPLGSGGMGTVYEAEDNLTGRRVAVKLIRPEFADSPEAVERFRREGRLAGTVVHPRCVFVLAADEEAGRPYIVMELMPGDNLADLVYRNGPLPFAEAVALILDVIEGLQEMHRCGLIHRDVKPSNCFLDSDGRVKIGDFGLSKSLVKEGSLTQSRSFLGTLLFTSPEQIRNDKVDHQADLYSVSATLYFLLTGRPPFEAEDAAATLARIISDPLIPMCHWRLDLPATLDEVVLRGLARQRERRWQSLEELRLALLPFVPGSYSLAELGWRTAAYLADLVFVVPLMMILLRLLHGRDASATLDQLNTQGAKTEMVIPELLLACIVTLISDLLYFGMSEHRWGCTPGKYLFRLRVRTVGRNDRPSLMRALLRTFVFFFCKDTPPLLLPLLLIALAGSWLPALLLGLPGLELLGYLLGLLLLASTMRRANSYRGVHEFLSGTRVIRLPGSVARHVVQGHSSMAHQLAVPEGLPDRIGAFTILGALRSTETEKILLAEDGVLGRRVWLLLRRAGLPPLPLRRREVGRTTRARWLVCGRHSDWQWDAFVASEGCPLPELVQQRRRLSWSETLFLLEPLTEELVAACADGTLPDTLTLDQVWVQANGRVQLEDTPLIAAPMLSPPPLGTQRSEVRGPRSEDQIRGPLSSDFRNRTSEPNDQQRALRLLRDLVRLSLEGRALPQKAPPQSLQAPLPGYAARHMNRLLGLEHPYATVKEFHADMQSAHNRPAEVTRPRRSMHLTMQGLGLSIGLAFMLATVPLLLYLLFSERIYRAVQGKKELALSKQRRPVLVANLACQADAWGRLLPATRLYRALEDDWALEIAVKRFDQERELMLESSTGFTLRAHEHALRGMERFVEPYHLQPEQAGLTPARALVNQLNSVRETSLYDAEDHLNMLMVVGFWPAVWIVWAFLMRGGLSYRLAGITLVQKDGQPAARWRCAWRALLVWLPFFLLLFASLQMEVYRLSILIAAEEPPSMPLLAWLAWFTWWLALALLPFYCWVAQRSPDRALHDRLSGIYLVPS